MDLFRKRTDKTGTGEVPFTRQSLSDPFFFLSEPFQIFWSCKWAFIPVNNILFQTDFKVEKVHTESLNSWKVLKFAQQFSRPGNLV